MDTKSCCPAGASVYLRGKKKKKHKRAFRLNVYVAQHNLCASARTFSNRDAHNICLEESYIHSSQKLSPQHGMVTASRIIFLHTEHLSSLGTSCDGDQCETSAHTGVNGQRGHYRKHNKAGYAPTFATRLLRTDLGDY